MTQASHTAGPAPQGDESPLWAWIRAHRFGVITGAATVTALLVLVGLCAYLQPHTWRFYTDGVSVRRLAKDTKPRPVLWGDARTMACTTNLPADLDDPFVLADGVTLLFTSSALTGNDDLFSCRWNGREWDAPAPIPALNSAFNESGAVVSPDGQCLYFASDRPGGLGGYDIWVARWDGVTWAWPANLGYMINTKFDERGPGISPVDGRLFFASDRAERRLTAEEERLPLKDLRAQFREGDFDIYAADPVPVNAAINREIERLQSQLYSLRTGALGDESVMRKLGGSAETEAAVDRALAWLAANQETNGVWSAARNGGAGGHNASLTGFALLTFLGRGVKPDDGSAYGAVVSNGVSWLLQSATLNGDMRSGGTMYDQGIATLALTEAYGLTKNESLREPVQAAVNFIADAQHKDGGWRYTPGSEGDLSVSSWQIMALKSAELSGLMVSETVLAKAREWLREKMSHGEHHTVYSYTAADSGGQPAMQAAGFFCAQLLGISPNTMRGRGSADVLESHGLNPGAPNIYYWYNAVLGAYQYQGELWREWNQRLVEHYLPLQSRDGALAGSWDPAGHPHGGEMGRVIVTALFTLSLEVYYRYTPLYGLGYMPQDGQAAPDGWDADRIAAVPPYRRARPVTVLNSSADDLRPAFTRRGDFVYFDSNRAGGLGGYDVYRARVGPSQETEPENLGSAVNSGRDERSPALRYGGFELLFTSGRAAPEGDEPRLFASTSRYVRPVHLYGRSRGLADQLTRLRGRLIVLVAALAALLLFVRLCRKPAAASPRADAAGPSRLDANGVAPVSAHGRAGVLPWLGLALSVAAALGLILSVFVSLRSTVWCRYTDDVSLYRDAVDVTPRPVVWDFPARLSGGGTGTLARAAHALTPDGAGLLFAERTEGSADLRMSRYDGYTWSSSMPIGNLESPSNDVDAVLSRDGRRIFFASDRQGGSGGFDLWTASRRDGEWVNITNLGSTVNSAADERSPAPSPDGSKLLFASDRTGGETPDFDLFAVDMQVAVWPSNDVALTPPSASNDVGAATAPPPVESSGVGATTSCPAPARLVFSQAAPVDVLNSPGNELDVTFDESGDWLFFASDRKGAHNGFELYSARVIRQHIEEPANAGSEINTDADEQAPAVGQAGFLLIFASDREIAPPASQRPYSVSACEVTGQWDFSRWLALGSLIHRLRWWILAFLAALAGIIYLLTHFRDFTSLKAKCLMASVLVHLVILLVMSLWVISSKFVESRASRKQEVSLNIDSLAQEKLALDVTEMVTEMPKSKVSVVAEQMDEALPLPDFKPVQRAVQTVVARSVAESFVEEATPSTGTPETRRMAAPRMPKLPDIQPPRLDVVLRVENPLIEVADAEAELFRPLVNVPSVVTSRVDVLLPGPQPVLKTAGVSDVSQMDQSRVEEVSLIRDTGGSLAKPSAGVEVSSGLTELKGPGRLVTARLVGGDGDMLSLALPGKLDVPAGRAPHVSPYKLRHEAKDNTEYLEGLGGNRTTQGAVGKALDWLTRHQEPEGNWSIQKHGGQAGHDVAASGLALLCYLGWGTKHNEPGDYQPSAAKAVAWLRSQVKPDGDCRGAGGNMYDQGIAAIALGEAYALTRDPALIQTVSNVVQFIVKAQHAGTGGWRYEPGQSGDTSVFGWQLMAVMSARMAGLDIPETVLEQADKWLTSVGGGSGGGLYGYENKSSSRGMAAEGMFCRQIMGASAEEPRMVETADYLRVQPPAAGQVDYYYWYYGTLAMYQHRGPAWEAWNENLKTVLPPMQAVSGDEAGSWPPSGAHGGSMGRVVATALSTLSLEVYYRYLPFAFTKGGAAADAKP